MATTRGEGGGYGGKTTASKRVTKQLKQTAPTRKRYATKVKQDIAAPHSAAWKNSKPSGGSMSPPSGNPFDGIRRLIDPGNYLKNLPSGTAGQFNNDYLKKTLKKPR